MFLAGRMAFGSPGELDSLLCCNPNSPKIVLTPGLNLCFVSHSPYSLLSSSTGEVKDPCQSYEKEIFNGLATETESTAEKRS